MPTFFERPLTWLLVAVFVVLDALVVSGSFDRPQDFWVSAIFLCQIYFMGEWLLRTRIHWLWRLAGLVAAVSGLTLIIYSYDQRSDWNTIFPLVFFVFLSCLMGMMSTLGLRSYLSRENAVDSPMQWQISVMEIIGLTLVVAVACWLSKDVPFLEVLTTRVFSLSWGFHILTGLIIGALVSKALAMRVAGFLLTCVAMVFYFSNGSRINYRYQDWALANAMVGSVLFIRSFEPPLEDDPSELVEE